jgi:hypothetical protein
VVTGWYEEATDVNYKAGNTANAHALKQATHIMQRLAQAVRYRQTRADLEVLLQAVRKAQAAARRNRKVAMDLEADLATYEAALHVALENGDYVEPEPEPTVPLLDDEWLDRATRLYGIERHRRQA